MAKIDYTARVPIPRPEHMNGGLNYPTVQYMTAKFGRPRAVMYDDCMPPTNSSLKKLIVYGYDVGPFNVSGLRKAAESLKRIFSEVKEDKPDLYEQLGTAGMLCCRNIRGTKGYNPSNHSWGSSIDLKIKGILDQRADAKCQRGLLELYKYFHEEGWWWGAEYRGPYEDSMHWDVAMQTLNKWYP